MSQPALFDDVQRGAGLSTDRRYRYWLQRRWGTGPLLGWIMLNPSIADADLDDRTVRRCIGFARRERFAGIEIANLFAYRTPKPSVLYSEMRAGVDVVGPANDDHLAELLGDRFRVKTVVAAWGSLRRPAAARRALVLEMADRHRRQLIRLAPDLNAPAVDARHPLFTPAAADMVAYSRSSS